MDLVVPHLEAIGVDEVGLGIGGGTMNFGDSARTGALLALDASSAPCGSLPNCTLE